MNTQKHTQVTANNNNVLAGINTESLVVQSPNKLYNWVNPAQGYISPAKRLTVEIQPTLLNSNLFNSANNYLDFNFQNQFIDKVESMYLMLQLSNSSSTVVNTLATVPYFLINRIELLISDQIVQTITPSMMYLDQTAFETDVHLTNNVVNTAIDPSTFDINSTYSSTPISGSITYRLPLNNLITRCGLTLSTITQRITLRVYSNVYNLSAGASSTESLSKILLYVQYKKASSSDIITKLQSTNLDYRFLDVVQEEVSLNLTSGSWTSYVTQNYTQSMLASHLFVVFRTNTLTSTFDNVVDTIYFEDSLGNMMDGSIQWSSAHLLEKTYPDLFGNLLSQTSNKSVYTLLVGALNPYETLKTGVVSGYSKLDRNMKLNLLASSTGTYTMTIFAYVYRHARVANGNITFN